LLTLLALLLIHRNFKFTEISEPDYIARIDIEGVITTDRARDKMLNEIYENDKVKAVLVYLDTPGGTAIGGEELYLELKRIRDKKPVVILMRTVAASAGYMTAMGGSHIFAREGTLTGSVGVIMQTMEFSELAKNLGIEPIIVKSGRFKAEPNPLTKVDASERELIQNVVQSFYGFFIDIVKTERKFTSAQMAKIEDGRVFTGRQALEMGLIDALGGEREALAWLEENHEIPADTDIETLKPKRPKDNFFTRLNEATIKAMDKAENFSLTLDGLLMIWQPADFQK
jgi:protease-4